MSKPPLPPSSDRLHNLFCSISSMLYVFHTSILMEIYHTNTSFHLWVDLWYVHSPPCKFLHTYTCASLRLHPCIDFYYVFHCTFSKYIFLYKELLGERHHSFCRLVFHPPSFKKINIGYVPVKRFFLCRTTQGYVYIMITRTTGVFRPVCINFVHRLTGAYRLSNILLI